jgi:HAD superfamily hydrolase (TIGR01509 family)
MANFYSYSQALAEEGHDFDLATFLTTWGQDSRTFLPHLFPSITAKTIQHIQVRKAEIFSSQVSKTKINEALLKILKQFKLSGLQLGLVTTAKRASLVSLLEHYGELLIFDFIIAGDEVIHGKPNPEAYLKALSIAGCNTEEALTFEDSDAGQASAEAAGIGVVRISFTGE